LFHATQECCVKFLQDFEYVRAAARTRHGGGFGGNLPEGIKGKSN
jgi:hypothetical protein